MTKVRRPRLNKLPTVWLAACLIVALPARAQISRSATGETLNSPSNSAEAEAEIFFSMPHKETWEKGEVCYWSYADDFKKDGSIRRDVVVSQLRICEIDKKRHQTSLAYSRRALGIVKSNPNLAIIAIDTETKRILDIDSMIAELKNFLSKP